MRAFDTLVPEAAGLQHLVSLIPPFDDQPDSSLSFMVSDFARTRFRDHTTWAIRDGQLDRAAIEDGLAETLRRDQPLLLFTTTLAATALLEAQIAAAVPPGSLILTTGGGKGRRTDVDVAAIESALASRFPGARVGAEYGMTELLSQAYRTGDQPFRLPAWCRVLAIDPLTGGRVPHGQVGLLRFVDLANVQSAVAIQTADRGITHTDQTFTLLGRAAGAPLRGCSLTFEEMAAGLPPEPADSRSATTERTPAAIKPPQQRQAAGIPSLEQRLEVIASSVADLREAIAASPALSLRIAAETGLHPRSLASWLDDWCTSLGIDDLGRLVASAQRPFDRGEILTLAPGNVPVVAAECLVLGLLAGTRHTLALSTRGQHLVRALHDLIGRRRPTLAGFADLVVWRELTDERRRALLAQAGRVVAYGTAETVEWLATQVPAGTAIVPHGPSVAIGWMVPAALSAQTLSDALRALAEDVAAYDQRGCRSPHVLAVRGTEGEARVVAEMLATDAFPWVEATCPRGRLTEIEQTRGFLDGLTSERLGRSWEGDGWSVSLELAPTVLRASPLGRRLRVVRLPDGGEGTALLATLGAPVTLVATPDGSIPSLGLPDLPEVRAMGSLRASPFDRLHDGRHRLDELLPPGP